MKEVQAVKLNPIGFLFFSAFLLSCAIPGHTENQNSFLDTLSAPEPQIKTNTVENPVSKSSAASIVEKTLQIRDASGQIKLLTIFVPTFVLPTVKAIISRPAAPRSISSILADKARNLMLLKKLRAARNIPSAENIVSQGSESDETLDSPAENIGRTDSEVDNNLRRAPITSKTSETPLEKRQ